MEQVLQKAKRIYFLDNLKTFIIGLMIVFHVAMCYMAYAPEWWYTVDNADPKFSFLLFVLWTDIFIMPVMFFVSGYFGIMSLSKQDGKTFWKSKLLRIALPWVAGALLLAPPVTYMMFLTRGVPLSYSDYLLPVFFFGPCFSHTQYWYLGMLMYFYLILYIVCKVKPGFAAKLPISIPSTKTFIALAVICYVATLAAYVLVDGNNDLWTFIWPILVYQPTRTPMHLIYFFLGVYAWRHQWFVEGGYKADPVKWIPACIVTSVAYLYFCIFGQATTPDMVQYSIIKAALHVLFLLSAVFSLFAIFQTKLNYTNKFLTEMAVHNYTMYYAHMGIIMLIAWGFVYIDIPVYLKWVVVSALGLFVTYLVSKILILLPCFATGKKASK